MNRKLGLLSLVAVFALSTMGMSYANDEYVIFWGPVVSSDNEVGKDVGFVESAYVNQTGVLIISISNAYPGYEAYIDFSFKNSSSNEDEYYYKGFNVYDYDDTALGIVVSGIDTGVLAPGTVYNGRLNITMLPSAKEDQSYSFELDIDFSDEPN